MSNTKELTAGELEALKTILRTGGQVIITRGRKAANTVHTGTYLALEARGLVRPWNNQAIKLSPGLRYGSKILSNIAVTALGCNALEE